MNNAYTVKESTKPCNVVAGTLVQRLSEWDICDGERIALFTIVVKDGSFGTFNIFESQVEPGWIWENTNTEKELQYNISMQTIKIDDIIKHSISLLNLYTDRHDRTIIANALDEIVRSEDRIDEREYTVQNYIGKDPYSWLVIPNFLELEESGVDNIYVEYADGMVVEAPLCY